MKEELWWYPWVNCSLLTLLLSHQLKLRCLVACKWRLGRSPLYSFHLGKGSFNGRWSALRHRGAYQSLWLGYYQQGSWAGRRRHALSPSRCFRPIGLRFVNSSRRETGSRYESHLRSSEDISDSINRIVNVGGDTSFNTSSLVFLLRDLKTSSCLSSCSFWETTAIKARLDVVSKSFSMAFEGFRNSPWDR